jgi:tetrahydromethanopterin S-methyltransferase subunit A
MADKKSPASGWPLVKGDFMSGDANSPVAVVTMGSHLDEKGICDAGAALCGSCKTENLGDAAIKRFQEQTEIVNIMESEDLNVIKAKINELKARDPGAFAADAIVVEVKEAAGGAEETGGEVRPLSGEMALITARMKVIEKMVTNIGYRDKFAAGVYAGKIEGLMIGLIISFALVGFLMMR